MQLSKLTKQQTLHSQMIRWVPLLFCHHHFHSCYHHCHGCHNHCHGCHAHLMAWSPSSVLPVIRTWDPTAANLRTGVIVMTLVIVMMMVMVMMIAILMMVMLIAIVMAMIKNIETLAWRKSTAWFVPWTWKAIMVKPFHFVFLTLYYPKHLPWGTGHATKSNKFSENFQRGDHFQSKNLLQILELYKGLFFGCFLKEK